MLKILTLVTAALVALTIPLDAQESDPQRDIIEAEADGAVIHRVGGQDQIVRIRAKTRHTTVIVLPANGKRTRFCGRRFRILAPDRSR